MHTLEFAERITYRSEEISVPTRLRYGRRSASVLAIFDSGASHCFFQRLHAELLGIEVESGQLTRIVTATGVLEAYGHEVLLESLGMRFESVVYFFADPFVNKDLLGRQGWLDRIRLGVVHHDAALYAAPYDFAS